MEIYPINADAFLKSMASSAGVLCNAGFGTTSEALFLKKKLLVIPTPDHSPPVPAAVKLNGAALEHTEVTGFIVASACARTVTFIVSAVPQAPGMV